MRNINCIICDRKFITKGSNAKYCKNCKTIKCVGCGNPFISKQLNAYNFCSKLCKYKSSGKKLTGLFGEKNYAWKGGRHLDKEGYVKIYRDRRYILEHRLVMENELGRKLKSHEQVHHKNKVKDDNGIKNLEIVINKNHFGKIECPKCNHQFLIK